MAPKTKFERKVSRGLIDPSTGKPTAKGVKRENTKKAIGNVVKGALGSAVAGIAASKLGKINRTSSAGAGRSSAVSKNAPYKSEGKGLARVGGIEQYYNESTGKYDRDPKVVKTERHVARRANSKSGK
jgi:type IV secretory pathway TrbL component